MSSPKLRKDKRQKIIEPVSAAKILKPEMIKNAKGSEKSPEDRAFIQNCLKQHYLLFTMTHQDLTNIVEEMALCEIKANETFIK